jgi:hypothetical protein
MPLFLKLQIFIRHFDIVLYSIIVGSVLGVAYYSVSLTIAAIVGNSGVISQALYPKLLAENKFDGIKKNFDIVLFFAIPLLGITIIFSKSALYALNPIYQEAWPIVILLSIQVFLQSLRRIPAAIITGKDQIDTKKNLRFSQLIQSNLFHVPKILVFFNILFIGILATMLFSMKSIFSNELDLVFLWGILAIIFEIPLFVYFWIYSRKYEVFSFPKKNVIKYIISTIIFMVFFVFSSEHIITYENNIYKFLPSLIFELSLCIGIYLSITYFISSDVRSFIRSIIRELKFR